MTRSSASAATITSSTAGGNGSSSNTNSKLRQLKDRMWMRETLEDITAAEFASSLSVEREDEEEDALNSDVGQMVKMTTTTTTKWK